LCDRGPSRTDDASAGQRPVNRNQRRTSPQKVIASSLSWPTPSPSHRYAGLSRLPRDGACAAEEHPRRLRCQIQRYVLKISTHRPLFAEDLPKNTSSTSSPILSKRAVRVPLSGGRSARADLSSASSWADRSCRSIRPRWWHLWALFTPFHNPAAEASATTPDGLDSWLPKVAHRHHPLARRIGLTPLETPDRRPEPGTVSVVASVAVLPPETLPKNRSSTSSPILSRLPSLERLQGHEWCNPLP